MPRNGSGVYTLPAGNPVVPDTLIEAAWANSTLEDVANALTGSLARDGSGGMTGPFRILSGTAATPGLGFTLEPSTGLYRVASGVIGITVSGARRLEINTTGLVVPTGNKITITDAPTAANDAANKAYVDGRVVTPAGATGSIQYRSAGGAFAGSADFTYNGTGQVVITSGALVTAPNIVIGRAAGSTNYADAALEIRGTAGDMGISLHNGSANAIFFVCRRASGNLEILDAGNNPAVVNTGRQIIQTPTPAIATWVRTDVGSSRLWVMAGSNALQLFNGAGTAARQTFQDDGMFTMEGPGAGTYMQARDNAAEYTLEYVTGNSWRVYNANSATVLMQVSRATGDFTATGNVIAFSDERLKENIVDRVLTADEIRSIRSVAYDRIDTKQRQVGVLAQQVREIAPECVVEHDDGMLGVDYGRLALLVALSQARV